MRFQEKLPLQVFYIVHPDLGIVALGSAGLLAATLTLQPKQPRPAYLLALLGLLPFSFQTIILDAIAWPAYF
jgi:hypothetical protein